MSLRSGITERERGSYESYDVCGPTSTLSCGLLDFVGYITKVALHPLLPPSLESTYAFLPASHFHPFIRSRARPFFCKVYKFDDIHDRSVVPGQLMHRLCGKCVGSSKRRA